MGQRLKQVVLKSQFRVVDGGRLTEVLRGGAWLRESLGSVEQVNVIQLAKGALAGSHVHKEKREILYIQQGTLQARFRDMEDGEEISFLLPQGSLLLTIPGVAHQFKNGETETALILEFANRAYAPDAPDTEKVEFA